MKKTLSRILLLALATALLAMTLTACGGPSGKYRGLGGILQLEFSGSNVTISTLTWDGSYEELGTGTYEINSTEDGGKTMTITFEGEIGQDSFKIGEPVTYVENDDGSFKYGLLTFTKVKES